MGRVWTDGPLTTLLKSLKNVQISEEGTMVHVSGDSAKSTEHYAIDFDRARGFLAMSFLETKPLPAGELRTEYVIRDAKAINGTWTATSAFVSSGFYRKTAPPFTNDFVIDYFDIAPYEGKDWPAHIPAIPKGSIVGSTDGSLYRADAKHEWHYWAQMGRSRHGIDFGTGMMLAFSAGTAILIVLWRVLTARKRVSNH